MDCLKSLNILLFNVEFFKFFKNFFFNYKSTLLELVVYDITSDKFIPNSQFIGPINTNAKSSTSKDLGIIEAVVSIMRNNGKFILKLSIYFI